MKASKAFKSALSVILCFVMLAGLLPSFAVDVDSKNEYEKILEENGFMFGINYPWLTGGPGHSLTSNELLVKYVNKSFADTELNSYGIGHLYQDFYNIKAMGYSVVGFWGSCYGEGVIFDPYGDVLGVKQDYLDNLRIYLETVRRSGLKLLYIINAHSETISDYYSKECWDVLSQMYCNPKVTEHYIERFVTPVCKVLSEYKDVLALISAGCEPENEINDSLIADSSHVAGIREIQGVTKPAMENFLRRITDTVAELVPGVARTMVSNAQYLNMYNDFDLDVMGKNRYNSNGNAAEIEPFCCAFPMIVTEWGVDEYKSDEQYEHYTMKYQKDIVSKGYNGSVLWCYLPEQAGNQHSMFPSDMKSVTDYRSVVYSLHYYMTDFVNDYKGIKTALEAPVMLYQDGSGHIEWFASRQAKSLDIQRTYDGNTVETLVAGVSPSQLESGYKGVYDDTSMRNGGYVAYRVVAHDNKGNTAASEWSNKHEVLRSPLCEESLSMQEVSGVSPTYAASKSTGLDSMGVQKNRPRSDSVNLITEDDLKAVTGYALKLCDDKTAPESSTVLCYDTFGAKSRVRTGFKISVKPNTDYVFSVWLKGPFLSAENLGLNSVGIADPETRQYLICDKYIWKHSTADKQLVPPAWDNEWHLRSVSFNSGSMTEVMIMFCGVGTKLYMDGMALYKASDGVQFTSPLCTSTLSASSSVRKTGCQREYNLISNFDLSSGDAAWSSAPGWENCMSVLDSKVEYGSSLKYSESSEHVGSWYIRWIDVTPHTDYIFSMDMRVTGMGSGYFALLDGNYTVPDAFWTQKFLVKSGWSEYAVKFNSGVYSKIGIAVCDKGGSALFDNLRLFEAQYAKNVTDSYVKENIFSLTPVFDVPLLGSIFKVFRMFRSLLPC